MSRDLGGVEAIQELLPEWLVVVLAVVTQLGDVWLLALVLATAYWRWPSTQDDVAMVGGLFLAGLGAYRALKELLRLPRPDAPPLDVEVLPWGIDWLYAATASASGYGFPSGHATNATVVYVGLALVLPIGTRTQRLAVAAGLVALVGVSRVVLGVHYVVDIVVGAALGLVVVTVGVSRLPRLARDRGTPVFVLAVATTAVYLAVDAPDDRAWLMAAAALGLLGGWQLVVLARYLVAVERPSAFARPLVGRGALALATLGPLALAASTYPLAGEVAFGRAGAVGLGAALALVVPIARYSPRVRRGVAAVRFWLASLWRAARSGWRWLWCRIGR